MSLRFLERCALPDSLALLPLLRLVSPRLHAPQSRPMTWYVQSSLMNSSLKMEITFAGSTAWRDKNKVSSFQDSSIVRRAEG
jgi:hypothetical protein